jgi:uncharacterized cupin superfamily protein
MANQLLPLVSADVPVNERPSNYPEPFASRMAGRFKRALGARFGLTAFGANLTTLMPGAVSALHHRHSRSDEFVYLLDGELVLCSSSGEWTLKPGMCAGFPAQGASHHLENRSAAPATFLENGSRTAGDLVTYPADDLVARESGGQWRFETRDGRPLASAGTGAETSSRCSDRSL